MRDPCFDNLLRVLQRAVPDRPTLFEAFLGGRVCLRLSGYPSFPEGGGLAYWRLLVAAFRGGGYDHVALSVPGFAFPAKPVEQHATRSLNAAAVITDRSSFDAYPWPNPTEAAYSLLDDIAPDLPHGMKLVVYDPSGVLETVVELMGFERLCYLLADDPPLVADVFEAVGSRLARYFETVAAHETVGALMASDDWGFATQTMLPPDTLRRLVFPWHRRIVRAAHAAGKPALLHSCGQLEAVMDDIIDDLQFDGKHSFEDKILPVEEAYARWGGRIALLGGLDVDFLCRATPERVRSRSRAMLARAERGGYALGTGNSVPDYLPEENYFAMLSAAAGEEDDHGLRAAGSGGAP